MRSILAVLLLFSFSALAKPWDDQKVIARIDGTLKQDLERRGMKLIPNSVSIAHEYGFRATFSHLVHDWTFGQLGALISDGKFWDDTIEQFNVTFYAESSEGKLFGETSIAVLRYAGNQWLIQYYANPGSLVATEVFQPKYTLTPAGLQDIFHTVAVCRLKNPSQGGILSGTEPFSVMVNSDYERAFADAGVPVVLAATKDVKDAKFDIRGRSDFVKMNGFRRFELLIARGTMEVPTFGSVSKKAPNKVSLEMTASTDNSLTAADAPENVFTVTDGSRKESQEMICEDTRTK